MSGATKAPALSSTPSMPSASAASAHTFCCPISAAAKPRQNSPARPPRPLGAPGARGRIVTVVSPPDRITQGLAKDAPRWATARASAPCTLPTSRDSPSISSERMWASMPAARAAVAAASSDCCGVAITCVAWPRNTPSPGWGVPARRSRAGHAPRAAPRSCSGRGSRAHRRRWWHRAPLGRWRSRPGHRRARR